ncbi:MAG: hypothetical protein IJR47_01115, partial [Clostridia bacterium]|nr:hypothetical protein [Clostridia bacterium]
EFKPGFFALKFFVKSSNGLLALTFYSIVSISKTLALFLHNFSLLCLFYAGRCPKPPVYDTIKI